MFSWRLLGVGLATLLAGVLVSLARSAPAATVTVVEFPVVTVLTDQDLPAISGDLVVWRDMRNGAEHIYGKQLPTGFEFPVTTYQSFKGTIAISGDTVVWADWRNAPDGSTNADIYGRNLTTGAEFPVVTNTTRQANPAISGNIVVWDDDRNGGDCGHNGRNCDIYGKNLVTGVEFQITSNSFYQGTPDISGDIVVWTDGRSRSGDCFALGNCDIYGKDLATGLEFQITTDSSYQGGPAISGNIVVWMDHRNGNGDIYGRDLGTGEEFPVTTNPAWQGNPAVSGNVVVWMDYRNGNYDIYGKDISTGVEFQVVTNSAYQGRPAIDGNTVVWDDWRNGGSGNSDIYGAWLGAGPPPFPVPTPTPTPTRTPTPGPSPTPTQGPLQVRDVRATPNPFNPDNGTFVTYTLSKAANAALLVLDGELSPIRSMGPVARPGGRNSFLWDGRNQAGQVISSGLYIPIVAASAGAESAYGYTLAIADDGVAPAVTNVVANPPNIVPPGGTTVSYQVSKGSVQVLLVLNQSGTEMRRIIAGYKKGGPVSIFWDGRNNAGQYVPDGSYILVPVAVDLLGRVGYNFTIVRVGTGAAISVPEAQKIASAWVEGHRDELAELVRKAVEARLRQFRSTD